MVPPEFDFQRDFKSINLSNFSPPKNPSTGASDLDYVQTVNQALFNSRVVFNDGATPSIKSDVLARRPSPGIIGRLFLATDTYELFRDLGNTWVNVTAQQSQVMLPPTGVAPGTYDRVEVNERGLVVNGYVDDFVHARFKYLSPAPATFFSISHPLNTLAVDVYVLVKSDGGTWVNDLVKTEVVDESTINVWLTEARDVMVNVIKLD